MKVSVPAWIGAALGLCATAATVQLNTTPASAFQIQMHRPGAAAAAHSALHHGERKSWEKKRREKNRVRRRRRIRAKRAAEQTEKDLFSPEEAVLLRPENVAYGFKRVPDKIQRAAERVAEGGGYVADLTTAEGCQSVLFAIGFVQEPLGSQPKTKICGNFWWRNSKQSRTANSFRTLQAPALSFGPEHAFFSSFRSQRVDAAAAKLRSALRQRVALRRQLQWHPAVAKANGNDSLGKTAAIRQNDDEPGWTARNPVGYSILATRTSLLNSARRFLAKAVFFRELALFADQRERSAGRGPAADQRSGGGGAPVSEMMTAWDAASPFPFDLASEKAKLNLKYAAMDVKRAKLADPAVGPQQHLGEEIPAGAYGAGVQAVQATKAMGKQPVSLARGLEGALRDGWFAQFQAHLELVQRAVDETEGTLGAMGETLSGGASAGRAATAIDALDVPVYRADIALWLAKAEAVLGAASAE